ncbi:MAG: hypothetical protein AAF206_19985 [Bacteroidota bacterium]
MKHILFACLLTLNLPFLSSLFAQQSYEGILRKNAGGFQAGDKVKLIACRINPEYGPQIFFINKLGDAKSINARHITMVSQPEDFWTESWWKYRSTGVLKATNLKRNRIQTYQLEREQFEAAIGNGNVGTEDAFQEDYLQQLLHRIHPAPLGKYIDQQHYLTAYLLPTDKNLPVFYQHGAIVIPPLWLAKFEYEHQLAQELANLVAHIILEHKVSNASFLDNQLIGVRALRPEQTSLALQLAKEYIAQADYDLFETPSNRDAFTRKISGSILLAAREAYARQEYEKAISSIDRLITVNAASEEAYLLKARIYRRLYNSESSNRTALTFLQKAQSLSTTTNLDILSEQGLVYMRLGDYEKAKVSFFSYDKGLASIGGYEEERRWVKEMLFQCNSQLGTP